VAVLDLVAAVPASGIVLLLLVRYLPDALLTLLAGTVAVLSRDRERGGRAVAVLRLLRTQSRRRDPPPVS
jgi:hypothetical protein